MMVFVLPIVLLASYFTGPGTPSVIKYAPELCGIVASAYIVIHAVRHGFVKVRFVYWILIVLLALHILFGIIANGVQVGTVIIGGRMYLRTIPFFLLAITLMPGEAALKKHFFIVLAVTMLQLPLAIYQRLSHYQAQLIKGNISTTGDLVMGTLGQSHFLSLFLICFATVIVALYAKKRISFGLTVAILFVVLAPTMINETKATFFLAPLAIAIPMLAGAGKNWIKNGIKTVVLLIGFMAVFLSTYDYLVQPRWGYGLIDFLTMEGRLEGYLNKGAEVGTTKKAGRFDSISVAVNVLSKDPTSTVFGLGMGNVTESSFGPQYEGSYFSRYGIFAGTTYGRLLWEIGFLGVAFVLFLLLFVFNDARRSYKQENAYGLLAHAYLAIVPIVVVAMLYKNLLLSPGISVCFWYYCGVVAAASQRSTSRVAVQISGQDGIPIDYSDAQAAK